MTEADLHSISGAEHTPSMGNAVQQFSLRNEFGQRAARHKAVTHTPTRAVARGMTL